LGKLRENNSNQPSPVVSLGFFAFLDVELHQGQGRTEKAKKQKSKELPLDCSGTLVICFFAFFALGLCVVAYSPLMFRAPTVGDT
jgi:hypothetical protein